MSDLMSALIFVFILTLVMFVLRYQIETDRLTGANEERQKLLDAIKQELEKVGETRVEIDSDQGVVRFGEAILFDSGKADIKPLGEPAIARLATVLGSVLPCYSASRIAGQCGDLGTNGMVDAVFIEGHTDSRPFAQPGREFADNWDLSSARARRVFDKLKSSNNRLGEFRNEQLQPLFSVSGYADSRLVSTTADDPNRRIDLRFVMVPPRGAINQPATQTAEGMKQQ